MKHLQPRVALAISSVLASSASAQQATGGNLSHCRGGCRSGEKCIGNSFSQPVSDAECSGCAGGQYWWPCNFETLCYCNDAEESAPRVPPAPKSWVKLNEEVTDPCAEILTEDVFNKIVQPKTEEGRALFTYRGLCDAIEQYNSYHDEKFARMGTTDQIRAELAAFLAHTATDTRGYSLLREEIHCAEPITGTDGKTYCKVCKEETYDRKTRQCTESYFRTKQSYEEYCDKTRQPPMGCGCNKNAVMQSAVPVELGTSFDTTGYVAASDMYFTRVSKSKNAGLLFA